MKEITELISEVVDALPEVEKERLKHVGELFEALSETEAFKELEKSLWIFREAVNDMVFVQPERAEYLRGVRVGLETISDIVRVNVQRARQVAREEHKKMQSENDDIVQALVEGLGGQVAESYE